MKLRSELVITAALLLPILASGQTETTDKKLTAREMFLAARDETPAQKPKVNKPQTGEKATPRVSRPVAPDAPKSPVAVEAQPDSTGNVQERDRGTGHPKPTPPESPAVPEEDSSTVQTAYRTGGPPLGVRYTLKKLGERATEVSPDTAFHSGDRIQLGLEVSEAGYLYIVTQGSSGTWEVLFPAKDIRHGDNRVTTGRTYSHVFSLVGKPGMEKLFVIFSRQSSADLDRLIYSLQGGSQTPGAAPGKGEPQSLPQLYASVRPLDDAVVSELRNVYSRDLIIEKMDEKAEEAAPGKQQDKSVYVVNPHGGTDSRVVADISLIHE